MPRTVMKKLVLIYLIYNGWMTLPTVVKTSWYDILPMFYYLIAVKGRKSTRFSCFDAQNHPIEHCSHYEKASIGAKQYSTIEKGVTGSVSHKHVSTTRCKVTSVGTINATMLLIKLMIFMALKKYSKHIP